MISYPDLDKRGYPHKRNIGIPALYMIQYIENGITKHFIDNQLRNNNRRSLEIFISSLVTNDNDLNIVAIFRITSLKHG